MNSNIGLKTTVLLFVEKDAVIDFHTAIRRLLLLIAENKTRQQNDLQKHTSTDSLFTACKSKQ